MLRVAALAAARRAPAAAPAQARGLASRKHKKFVKLAKGYRGRTNCFRVAVQRVARAARGRGDSLETGRGDAAAATWIFRGDGP